ncbi:DDE transposase family protein [Sphingobacterium luzhongxinii]|uniref:DDE transposase family protein n=1 Tax=Sphingobacterium luzhongxinii TaxID=2654181 RepID=UPI0013D9818B|nr:DDE transposase family protein [Sphingobacterium sp. xlx-73]
MSFTIAQKKEYAKTLYVSENSHQKAIAERVGVTEKTIGKWINEGGWKNLKRSLITTKQNQISLLYDQLEHMNCMIADRDVKVATSKEADVIIKLTGAIQKLETETGVGETVEVSKKIISLIQQEDLELAKRVTTYCDVLIQTMIK